MPVPVNEVQSRLGAQRAAQAMDPRPPVHPTIFTGAAVRDIGRDKAKNDQTTDAPQATLQPKVFVHFAAR